MALKGFVKKIKNCCKGYPIPAETEGSIPSEVGEWLIKENYNDIDQDDITLIITFSREIFVTPFFEAFGKMNLPMDSIHVLIYDNTQDPILKDSLIEVAKTLVPKFKSVRLYKSNLKGRGSITGSGNEIFDESKLFNIWSMWNEIYDFVDTKYFFQLEDDTIAPPNAFEKLFDTLMSDENVAMVTGIETGRTSYPWVPVRLGVHNIKVCESCGIKNFKICERRSFDPETKGIQSIDACGVYCFVARTELYKLGFKGYDPKVLKVPFFAMDNALTWNIKNQGYKVLADFDVWCRHLQASSARIISFGKEQALEMVDIWLPEYNNYAQGVEVKDTEQAQRRYAVLKNAPTWEI